MLLQILRPALALAIAMGAAAGCDAQPPVMLGTPGWNNPNLPLLLRPAEDGVALLLRQEGGPVALWQPNGGGRLLTADDSRWQRGGQPVSQCTGGRWPAGLQYADGRFTLRGSLLVTAGSRALSIDAAPGGQWAALLSSSGQGSGLVPFLSRGESPPFYAQFLHIDTGRLAPGAARLPFTGRVGGLVSCWSADGRHFLVLDPTLNGLVVLTLDLKETSP